MIAPSVIVMWPSTNASIPAGFTRATELDGRYPKGTAAGVDPDVNGGATTHTHTSTHTHTGIAHYHAGTTSRDGVYETHGGAVEACRDSHVHAWTDTSITGGSLSNSVTYAAVATDPPYYTVIFIKATGYAAMPTNAIAFYGSATLPANFLICDGANGTPDTRNKYFKGAATGADGGDTGGTFNHAHTINHTHTNVSHTHSLTTGLDSDSGGRTRDTAPGGGAVCARHTHTLTLAANTTEASSAYSGSAGTADTVEPAYKKIVAVKNTGGAFTPTGLICMWLGTLANIPIGYVLCDGNNSTPDMRGKFVKCANTTGEISDTGGSNTHTHAASNSHTHTATGTHTHLGSTDTFSAVGQTSAIADGASLTHNHPTSTCSSATSSWNANTISGDSADGQPAFQTIAFIQFQYGAGGAILSVLV